MGHDVGIGGSAYRFATGAGPFAVRSNRRISRLVAAALCTLAAVLAVGAAQAHADFVWSPPTVVSQPPFAQPTAFTAISCASTSLCVGVDQQGNALRSTNPAAAHPTWTPALITPPMTCSGNILLDCPVSVLAVSCPSTSLCVALDYDGNALVSTNPTAAKPTWTETFVGPTNRFVGISCPSASLCVAVEANGRVETSTNPAGPSPAWIEQPIDGRNTLSGISCPSTSLCVAVDVEGNAIVSADPGDFAWSAPIDVDDDARLTSVSCVSTSSCVAVGYENLGGIFHGQAVATSNPAAATPTWTATEIDTSPQPDSGIVDSVSCASTSLCVAIDETGNAVTSTNPLASTPTWTPTDINGPAPIVAVSCVAGPLCVAVDGTGSTLTSANPAAASPTWTIAAVDGRNPLTGVSCPSTSFCAAVDTAGNALTSTNPSAATPTWSTVNIDGMNGLTAISCPSTSLCAAVDNIGNALISTDPTAANPTWTVSNLGDGMHAVSCASTSLCAAIGSAGVLTTTNPTAANPAWTTTAVGASYVGGISCPSTSLCVADDAGDFFGGNRSRALATTNPTQRPATWTKTAILPGPTPLYGVSCASPSLCAIGDLAGDVLVSTDPGAAAPTWTTAVVGGPREIDAVSCPSVSLCVAVGNVGNAAPAVISTDPADPFPIWNATNIGGMSVDAISCVSLSLCVAVDGLGEVVIGQWSGPLPPPAPVNLTRPTISGTPAQGQALGDINGSWSNSPTRFHYQWEGCDGAGNSCSAISGATGQGYTPIADDVGHTIRVQETASNTGGSSTSAVSNATGVVQAAQSGGGGGSGGGAGGVSGQGGGGVTTQGTSGTAPGATGATHNGSSATPTLRILKSSGTTELATFACSGTQSCRLTLTLTAVETIKGGRVLAIAVRKKVLVLGSATVTIGAGHSTTARVSLNAAGKKLLARYKKLNAKLTVAESGKTVGTFTVTFKAAANHHPS